MHLRCEVVRDHPAPRVLVDNLCVSGVGFRVSGFEFRVAGFGFRVSVFEFRVSGFKFRVSGSGFRVSSLAIRVAGSRSLGETEISGMCFNLTLHPNLSRGRGLQSTSAPS